MPSTAALAELSRVRVANRVRGKLMQTALKELLDQVKGARSALPHLAALEVALGRRGATAIDEVPPHWLGRITSQLSSLPLREDDHELQDLLSSLCRALSRHQTGPGEPATQPPVPAQPYPEYLSQFQDSTRLEVREMSHSSFADEFPTQAGLMPPRPPRADTAAQPAPATSGADTTP